MHGPSTLRLPNCLAGVAGSGATRRAVPSYISRKGSEPATRFVTAFEDPKSRHGAHTRNGHYREIPLLPQKSVIKLYNMLYLIYKSCFIVYEF